MEKVEWTIITQALEETRWNKAAAAKKLGSVFAP
ncbi:MAG: helix-turn-helix domain-containing protein [Sedimenticola sp.]